MKTTSYHGMADPARRLAVIACGSLTDESEIMDTMAHEIGHILVGEGHPDSDNGPAPLPGTTHTKRLMCSGNSRPKDGSARLLVKGEWDRAENWLKDEEQRLQNPNP